MQRSEAVRQLRQIVDLLALQRVDAEARTARAYDEERAARDSQGRYETEVDDIEAGWLSAISGTGRQAGLQHYWAAALQRQAALLATETLRLNLAKANSEQRLEAWRSRVLAEEAVTSRLRIAQRALLNRVDEALHHDALELHRGGRARA